jgi:hypothetical protein
MRLARLVIAAAVLVPALAIAKQMDPISYSIMQLHDAAQCDAKTSPWRPWCLVDGFRDGTAAPLRAGTQLVGFTIKLAAGADAADALANKVRVCALSIGADHKVSLFALEPENDAERALTAEATASLAPIFKGAGKGEGKLAVLPAKLTSYITAQPATSVATAGSSAWSWTGKNDDEVVNVELAKVGNFWVAIALGPRPAQGTHRHQPFGAVWISILTDAWK